MTHQHRAMTLVTALTPWERRLVTIMPAIKSEWRPRPNALVAGTWTRATVRPRDIWSALSFSSLPTQSAVTQTRATRPKRLTLRVTHGPALLRKVARQLLCRPESKDSVPPALRWYAQLRTRDQAAPRLSIHRQSMMQVTPSGRSIPAPIPSPHSAVAARSLLTAACA